MQQRLMLRRRPRRSRPRGHRLHTLAFARQYQPGAIVAQRAHPVRVSEHARKTLHIRRKSSFAGPFVLPIHVSTSRAKLESSQIVDSRPSSLRPSDSVGVMDATQVNTALISDTSSETNLMLWKLIWLLSILVISA